MKKHMKLGLYPITIEPHEEGGYFASCPLFQGCHAEGETFGEAIDSMRDVIHAHIEARKEFAEFIPSVEFPQTAEVRFTLPVPLNH
jgi:predicted RNase H-like HicB family nuclease